MSTNSRITEAKNEYPEKEEEFFTVGDIVDELERGSSGEVERNEVYEDVSHLEIEIDSIIAGVVALSIEEDCSVHKRSDAFRIQGEELSEMLPDSFIDIRCLEGDIQDVSMNVSRDPGYDLSITPEYAFCFTIYHEPLFMNLVLDEEELEDDRYEKLMGRGEIYTSGNISIFSLGYFTPEAEEYYSD